MKVLYISSPSFADCDLPLVKALVKKGIDVTYLILISPYERRSTLIDIQEIYPQSGIFNANVYPEIRKYSSYMDLKNVYVSNRPGTSRKTYSYWKAMYELHRFIRKGKFDLIHTDLLFTSDFKWLYRCGCFVTTIHDPFPHSGEEWNYNKAKYLNAIHKSKGIVLLNENQKARFMEKYGVQESKILTNKLGIYDVIASLHSTSISKCSDTNKILFFGRIAPYKGIEYLCRAMKKVRESIPGATLIVAGGGKYYFDISEYQNTGYIQFLNHYIGVEELSELLYEASISVCPYTDATQSGVIMTSFAMGKPVIASNVGGLAEVIDNGRTGLLVKPRDVDSLATAIIKLLNDRKMLDEFGSNIKLLKTEKIDRWDTIADRYIKFYNNLIISAR